MSDLQDFRCPACHRLQAKVTKESTVLTVCPKCGSRVDFVLGQTRLPPGSKAVRGRASKTDTHGFRQWDKIIRTNKPVEGPL